MQLIYFKVIAHIFFVYKQSKCHFLSWFKLHALKATENKEMLWDVSIRMPKGNLADIKRYTTYNY